MKSLLPVLALGLLLLLLALGARCTQKAMRAYETSAAAPDAADANTAPNELAEAEKMAGAFPDTLLSTSGIRYRILTPGDGPRPIAGNLVTVHYSGRLLDGTVFDSSRERGKPFTFTLMKGEVIRGWDLTVAEMHRGEKRLVVIPSHLAYGKRGRPPVIPPRAPLVFEIELLDIAPAEP
ncbi:MAG: FKBP-type peptidyl-prolyl cis-trans isomerase [Verrucomicrobia bacterium]|nr:MAG: FKBP-type peptidyl-prolyl cis-trans isomerase [Verrucomicrobiota bacterium]